MLIALLADIHGNREALTACLADAERVGAERYVFLGDLVGYGADPAWVVERVAEMVEAGAVAVFGNHDAAVLGPSDSMNPTAAAAIAWTRTRLDAAHTSFLARLPLTVDEGDRLYVHASASAPDTWIYVMSAREAFQSFRATHHRLTFCGHTHHPALFNESARTLPHHHVPAGGTPIPVCQITVQDNGIGFDEKYLEKIFAVFQRLHGSEEYEGTGIGLAIVRKAVERMHGRVFRRRSGAGRSRQLAENETDHACFRPAQQRHL